MHKDEVFFPLRRETTRASDKHLQITIIFQISHCLLQGCLAQLNVSKDEKKNCQTVPHCRFIIKLGFLLLFWLQVLKNFAEKTDFDYEL